MVWSHTVYGVNLSNVSNKLWKYFDIFNYYYITKSVIFQINIELYYTYCKGNPEQLRITAADKKIAAAIFLSAIVSKRTYIYFSTNIMNAHIHLLVYITIFLSMYTNTNNIIQPTLNSIEQDTSQYLYFLRFAICSAHGHLSAPLWVNGKWK